MDAAETPPRTRTVWRQHAYGSADAVAAESVELAHPGRGEVLLRVEAASLNAGDVRMMRGDPALIRLVRRDHRHRRRAAAADPARPAAPTGHRGARGRSDGVLGPVPRLVRARRARAVPPGGGHDPARRHRRTGRPRRRRRVDPGDRGDVADVPGGRRAGVGGGRAHRGEGRRARRLSVSRGRSSGRPTRPRRHPRPAGTSR